MASIGKTLQDFSDNLKGYNFRRILDMKLTAADPEITNVAADAIIKSRQ